MDSVSFPSQPRTWAGRGLTVTVTVHHTLQVALHAAGELDLVSAPLLTACLENELDTGRRFARLDLGGLAFADSTGLSAVLDAHLSYLARHGMLVLTRVSPRVARVIDLLGLDGELLISEHPAPDALAPAVVG